MPFLKQAIKWARARAGQVSECEVDADLLRDTIVPQVVDTFSEIAPRRGAYSFQTVANQSTYDLPDPKIMAIERYSQGASSVHQTGPGLLGEGFQYHWGGYGSHVGHFTSQEGAAYHREQAGRSRMTTVELVADQVEVLPTPESVFTVQLQTYDYWTLEEDADFETIPRRLHNCFRYVLTAALAEHMAQDLAKVSQFQVGTSKVRLEWRQLIDLRDKMLEEAKAASPDGPGTIIGQG